MIEATALDKRFGPIHAVRGVSFSVSAGDVLGFLGPNGAGKSTTMKLLTGFLSPESGSAAIGGHDMRNNPRAGRALLGYLPERSPLYEEMTVAELLDFAAKVRGLRRGAHRRRRIAEMVETCHLGQVYHQPIETLSKGYRQRVGMAQAMVHDPDYLILDEPTDGLDPNQKAEVRRLIRSMAKTKAILLSTHILEEVESVCNRVIVLHRGKVVADETPRSLAARDRMRVVVEVTFSNEDTPRALEVLSISPHLRIVGRDGSQFSLSPANRDVDLPTSCLHCFQDHALRPTRFVCHPPRMEAVFARLTTSDPEV